jgi:hypothetical protein
MAKRKYIRKSKHKLHSGVQDEGIVRYYSDPRARDARNVHDEPGSRTTQTDNTDVRDKQRNVAEE